MSSRCTIRKVFRADVDVIVRRLLRNLFEVSLIQAIYAFLAFITAVLEAAFYEQGNAKNLVGGSEGTLLKTIQSDEEAHVVALTDTIKQLGGKPVAAPKVDFGGAFKDQQSFLELAHVFENTGVQAYLGAAPALFEEKELLSAAASIYGIEARHAAVIGDLLGLDAEGGVFMGSTETPKSKDEVLEAVMPFVKA